MERLAAHNRRTLDVLAARIYSYLSLAHERCGSLAAIRSALLGLHRTAVSGQPAQQPAGKDAAEGRGRTSLWARATCNAALNQRGQLAHDPGVVPCL